MSKKHEYDAIIVGSGPNGLAAAITLARRGLSILVIEAEASPGGGLRSAALTVPGFTHDICSTIHALAVSSPFFRSVPLAKHGVTWVQPHAALAHPFDDGTAAILERSLEATSRTIQPDGSAYRRLLQPFVKHADVLFPQILTPLGIPEDPWLMLRFGTHGLRSAAGMAECWFQGQRARGLFAGLAAHSVLPLEQLATSSIALLLAAAAHIAGWPVACGGSQTIADALVAYLLTLGGEIRLGWRIRNLDELPKAKAILFDVAPRHLAEICGHALPNRYRNALNRFRHGPGVFKLDWALDDPIPWTAPAGARAATVHIGGTFDEIAEAESAVWNGNCPTRPFVLLAQQSLFDTTRAPAGKHTAWAYCHVPAGSDLDMADRIESQIERFAPGFRNRILGRHIMTPASVEQHNANYIGGDITGGVMDLRQLFTRPLARLDPYSTPAKGIFLCSASTPPGPGVHGMCGFLAAQSVLRHCFRRGGEPQIRR